MHKYVYKGHDHAMIELQPKGTYKKVYKEDGSILLERRDPSEIAQKEAEDSKKDKYNEIKWVKDCRSAIACMRCKGFCMQLHLYECKVVIPSAITQCLHISPCCLSTWGPTVGPPLGPTLYHFFSTCRYSLSHKFRSTCTHSCTWLCTSASQS